MQISSYILVRRIGQKQKIPSSLRDEGIFLRGATLHCHEVERLHDHLVRANGHRRAG